LLDDGEKGQNLTVPEGISVYPYNTFWCWFGWLSFVLFCVGCLIIILGLDEW